MTVKYKKIIRKTWDFIKHTPKCPDKGAFEISYNGHTYFVLNGELHRTDGPAETWPNGLRRYCQYGKLHRIDGPAWIFPDGSEHYFLFGKKYKKELWEPLALQLRLKEQLL